MLPMSYVTAIQCDETVFAHSCKYAQTGRTALIWAAIGGRTDACRVLITAGADVDARTHSNDVRAPEAVQSGCTRVVTHRFGDDRAREQR